MGARVAVAGASGYSGGELLRLIAAHPELELAVATAASHAGQPIGAVHPHLVDLADQVFAPTDPAVLGDADVVFLALPHGQSAAIAATLPESALVVDIGADFRLRDPAAWAKFYGGTHAGTWTYGLPELPGARAEIAKSRRIANPGCYVTAATLALAPLFAAHLVDPDDVVVVAASGTSGAGRSLKPNLLASEVMGSLAAYKVGGVHQHTPEIEQNLSQAAGEPVTVSFTPILAPLPRGILATCTARPKARVDGDAIRAALANAYHDEPFVHLLPPDVWPQTAATLGSNSVHLQAAFDEAARRVVVVAALDNLTKGAAGQAIQNANIALGFPETTGLTRSGVAP
ncbi:MAG: N-acetyl-gamma-glutamyl-phosphate reductase [Acidothermus cellulolyticus]|nr:N-acetyl-gamma-glutamyl-phosphate reductase [Acidothermus cellulolyticus]